MLDQKHATGSNGFTLVELMVTVSVISILAAIGVPSYVNHVREAKVSEVHVSLGKCYRGVLAYYHTVKANSDGTTDGGSNLPRRMRRWVCPGRNFGSMARLGTGASLIDPRVYDKNGARAFKSIGFSLVEATHACYNYDTNTRPRRSLRNGDWFRCQAVTDVDDDDRYAYWYRTGTYAATTGSFRGGAVYHLATQDDW